MTTSRRPHPLLIVLLAIVLVYGGVATWRRGNRPPGRWVGMTHCAWRGQSTVTIRPGLRPIDSIAAAAHESVHVAECAELGPIRYRWRTLFAASNLALETPAYCAGASTRIRLNGDTAFIRATTLDDMMSAMGDGVDSTEILGALRKTCPQFAPKAMSP